MNFELSDGEILFIDPKNLPKEREFDELYKKLVINNTNPLIIKEIAYIYREDIPLAQLLLDLALEHSVEAFGKEDTKTSPGSPNDIKIEMIGLMMNHKKDPVQLFNELSDCQDKRVDLLKAFYLLNTNQIEDAMFLFNKVSYSLGVDLCHLKLNNKDEACRSKDFRIRCYSDSKEWTRGNSNEISSLNVDFKYRIGQSDHFLDENNIDVKITKITRKLKSIETETIGIDCVESLLSTKSADSSLIEPIFNDLKIISESSNPSEEIFYLMGKCHHLKNEYDDALVYYKKALCLNPHFLPAELNIKRIEEQNIGNISNFTALYDYKMFFGIKNNNFDISSEKCSDVARRIHQLIIKSRNFETPKLLENVIYSDAKIFKMFKPEVLYNNLAVIYYKLGENKEIILEFLNKALNLCDPLYQTIIKYNIGLVSENLDILEESPFAESQDQIYLIKKDKNSSNPVIKAFLLIKEDADKANKIFTEFIEENNKNTNITARNKVVFSKICLGYLYIQKYLRSNHIDDLNTAISIYKSDLKSTYCINGLAVCYALEGFVQPALRMLQQISTDNEMALANIGFCYMMLSDYKKAADYFIKANKKGKDYSDLIFYICEKIQDSDLIQKAIKAGVKEIEKLKEKIQGSDGSSNNNGLAIDKIKEEERKRKIAELEEYRKKLRFD